MKCVILPMVCLTLCAVPARAFQAQALVAQYALDEVNGSVVHDVSGNALDAVVQGGVDLGGPGAQPATGRSAEFSVGSAGSASIQPAHALSYLRSNLSVAAWVKPTNTSALMRIFGNRESGWSCARTATGLQFNVRFVQDYVVDCDVQPGRWTHVAFVFDSSFDVTFYVDGENVGTVTGIFPAYAPGPEWRLGSLDGATQCWDGRLDDVQIYVGALTGSEVSFLYANPGATLDRMVGVPYCFGDGHDAICPCYNYGDHDGGCINSTGEGARLRSGGSGSASIDDLRFLAERVPANQPVLLFVGNNATDGGMGMPYGDGLRCAGGTVRRLGVRHSGPSGTASFGPGLRAAGGWNPGVVRRFQAWCRDPHDGPCGSGFNTTQGVQVNILP